MKVVRKDSTGEQEGFPVINVLSPDAAIESGQIRVERAYPTAQFGERTDPRFDGRVKKVLEETGKLKYSKSDGGFKEIGCLR